MLICCMVAKFHWTLVIIKPGDRKIHYIDPMGEQMNSIKKEEVKWNCYLQQRYGVSEKFKILTLPHAIQAIQTVQAIHAIHAIQADGISCGVFCLKFAKNYINGEELMRVFPHEEVNAYGKRVVHLLLDKDKM
ncbi:uncharacterized protein LOC124816706 [Hydra vulgaris]|uniref:uncharacterized protein LOC124816706 n=1 Tax=Hydra vulgaris TaxID=6087 RepID=UPI001F5F8E54|nr:uncharacterized protein LOC124816706 [Hydra vulgaris]